MSEKKGVQLQALKPQWMSKLAYRDIIKYLKLKIRGMKI